MPWKFSEEKTLTPPNIIGFVHMISRVHVHYKSLPMIYTQIPHFRQAARSYYRPTNFMWDVSWFSKLFEPPVTDGNVKTPYGASHMARGNPQWPSISTDGISPFFSPTSQLLGYRHVETTTSHVPSHVPIASRVRSPSWPGYQKILSEGRIMYYPFAIPMMVLYSYLYSWNNKNPTFDYLDPVRIARIRAEYLGRISQKKLIFRRV